MEMPTSKLQVQFSIRSFRELIYEADNAYVNREVYGLIPREIKHRFYGGGRKINLTFPCKKILYTALIS
jgi:hypothetical protein